MTIVAVYAAKETTVNEDLFRLHVLANSDSTADQQVKLKVRDAVLAYLESKCKGIEDKESYKALVAAEEANILAVAEETLRANGVDYGAKMHIGIYDFPLRIYHDLAVPAGRYEALRIVLGDGAGQNWWCVMFPPLCFVDVQYEAVDGTNITNAELEEIEDIQVRSKVIEWLQSMTLERT
jgi:stage II sporulation protein R